MEDYICNIEDCMLVRTLLWWLIGLMRAFSGVAFPSREHPILAHKQTRSPRNEHCSDHGLPGPDRALQLEKLSHQFEFKTLV